MAQLKYRLMNFVLGLGATCIPLALCADATPPESTKSPEGIDDCAKELLLSYYPPEFVLETLKKFNVPKDKWEQIVDGLKMKDKEVIHTVEEKASQMDPNPLKDPQQRQEAIKIFKDTLLQIFSSVVKPAGITDDKTIQAMLDDIQQQKAKRFAQCIEKRKIQLPTPAKMPTPAASPSAPAPSNLD